MTPLTRVAVGVVHDAQAQVLVNQRPMHADFMPGYWEFPGGKVEPGETTWQALIRELKEELAIDVIAGHELMRLEHAYPQRRVSLEVWQVTTFSGRPEPQEGQLLKWCAPQALTELRLLPADGPIVVKLIELAHAH